MRVSTGLCVDRRISFGKMAGTGLGSADAGASPPSKVGSSSETRTSGEVLCKYCNSNQVVSDEKFGVVCTNCSMVLEEDVIVSQTDFNKQSNGTSAINGQFVGEFCTTPYSSWTGASTTGYMRSSRDQALVNGRKKIQWLATQLGLDSHYVDAAHRLFVLALQRNFIQGRKTLNVIAACLYIVCRRERAPRLLLDFSEVLQVNVYELGNVYLKFRRVLNIRVPVVDPTHYIERFAAKLEFEGKELEVSRTARTLVNRMRKDWIQTGRRPAGICAAALIVAARMHGFRRTRKEVVEVMRICEQTLKNRLMEFEATPSSNLTMEEFLEIDLPSEENPPSLKAAVHPPRETLLNDNGGTIQDGAQGQANGGLIALKAQEQEKTYKELSEELRLALSTVEKVAKDVRVSGTRRSPRRKRVQFSADSDKTLTAGDAISTSIEPKDDDSGLSDMSDDEAQGFLLSEAESKRKTALWKNAHQPYLDELAAKEQQDILAGKHKTRKRKRKAKSIGDASSAADATRNMVQQNKKISKKINYDKWNELFGADIGESGAEATSTAS